MRSSINVLGGPLEPCCSDPLTGFYRNGRCDTGQEDVGSHTVCTQVTPEFLEFSRATGNDLSTPVGDMFPGLKPGDCWCVCAGRWKEALDAGYAAPVRLASTHEAALEYVALEELVRHALDVS
jgi:uncharacterized protein (DUF2237 family)